MVPVFLLFYCRQNLHVPLQSSTTLESPQKYNDYVWSHLLKHIYIKVVDENTLNDILLCQTFRKVKVKIELSNSIPVNFKLAQQVNGKYDYCRAALCNCLFPSQ